MRGSKADRCSYAYLESPQIDAEQGRLRVRAHFSGRTASDFFGQCIGLGDAFDLFITALPYYHDGLIGLQDVRVRSTDRDGFYIRRVCAVMTDTLSRDFQYHLMDDARRILEEPRPNAPYRQQLKDLRVAQIRVTPQALVFTLDFGLTVQ